jgi:hypothetical protein
MNNVISEIHKDKPVFKKPLYGSETFEKMVNDIIKNNFILNHVDFLNTPNKIKNILDWHHINDEKIQKFFDILSNKDYIKYPIDKETKINEECPWENYTYYRNGLEIFIMFGYGSFISISPIGITEC